MIVKRLTATSQFEFVFRELATGQERRINLRDVVDFVPTLR
jgi:hypothetical protein